MSYKYKIIFGSFQDVEKQLDGLILSAKRKLDSGEFVDINVLESVTPLGISFLPAMIQGGGKQTAMIPVAAVLTLQWFEDTKLEEAKPV